MKTWLLQGIEALDAARFMTVFFFLRLGSSCPELTVCRFESGWKILGRCPDISARFPWSLPRAQYDLGRLCAPRNDVPDGGETVMFGTDLNASRSKEYFLADESSQHWYGASS